MRYIVKQIFANVDGFGVISDSHTKKKAPGIEQFFSKKFLQIIITTS